jgi:hypothetical protein
VTVDAMLYDPDPLSHTEPLLVRRSQTAAIAVVNVLKKDKNPASEQAL